MLQVDSKDVPNFEPIHIYLAGDKFTLEPNDYVVSLLSLNINWEDHKIRTVFTSWIKSNTISY